MGTIQIDGSTPKLTIGNATAEDATILFDGNAQDFYIALDDSADDLLIGLGSTVGTTPAIAIDENLKVNIPVTTASTSASTGSLTTGGGAGIGADLYVGDDVYLITDSAVLGFGADKDTTLTHTDGTGLTLNSTNKICFNDASQFIQGSSNAILALGATDEIDLTATAVDLNGTLDVSGTGTVNGVFEAKGGVIFNEGSADVDFRVESNGETDMIMADGGVSAVGINCSPNVEATNGGGDLSNAVYGLQVAGASGATGKVAIGSNGAVNAYLAYSQVNAGGSNILTSRIEGQMDTTTAGSEAGSLELYTMTGGAIAERMRINATGDFFVNTTDATLYDDSSNNYGMHYGVNAAITVSANGNTGLDINRQNSDGNLIGLYQEGSAEGTISVSGSTVSYNAFCGSHWSRLADNSKPTILRGTVMESVSEMMDWYVVEYNKPVENQEEITEQRLKKGSYALKEGDSVGDTVTYTKDGVDYTGTIVKEDNERLPKCKVSDTEDSKAVYGVFMAWDDDDDGSVGVNDMYVASLGAFVVRVHSGETVAIGDYLQSKGDGTAKVQADDILRASTIAKVTSTEKTITHGDGSYCVPCTLHCG